MWLDLRLNSSGLQVPNTESWPIGIANNSTLTIYKPDGTALTSLLHGADGADYDAVNLWTWGGLDHYVSSPVKVGDLGTYRFVITNTGESNWNGTMLPRVQWQLMEKPYFYFGVAGVVLGAACLIFAIAELRTLKKPMENLEN